jgi:hypothetical protein
MKTINLKFIAMLLCGIGLGIFVYHYIFLPRIIDQRANALGLMRYSHADGRMIPIDEYKWTFLYLKTGSMKQCIFLKQ